MNVKKIEFLTLGLSFIGALVLFLVFKDNSSYGFGLVYGSLISLINFQILYIGILKNNFQNIIDTKARRRRATTDSEKEECSHKRRAISKELKALRHDINLAKEIFPMIDHLKEKLRIEMEQEQEMFPRETGAKTQSKTKRNEEKQR